MDTSISIEPPTTACLSSNGLHVISPAAAFVDAMADATGFDLLLLATRAIRHDPGCIEARLVLAEHAEDMATRLRHLEAAVAAGEWLWNQVADKPEVDLSWWGDVGTRPYMRALAGLGRTLGEAGYPDEARACFERLLAMNPHDNQGIRFIIDDPNAPAASPRFR